MKIYYAHPVTWYRTDREKADVEAITKVGPAVEVVNPSDPEHDAAIDMQDMGGRDRGSIAMAYFVEQVRDADAIAYRTFDDDWIGAGVALEVFTAAVWGKQIFRLMDLTRDRGPMLFEQQGLRAAFGPRVLTIVQTRDRIKRGVM